MNHTSMALYRQRGDCRLCHSTAVDVAVPLKPVPVATPNVGSASVDNPALYQPVPLDLSLCRECGLLQLMAVGNPELQYSGYTYKTASSLGLADFFKRTAAGILADITPPPGALVVEFGSNDGTYLRPFKDAGMRVLGVDPATDIASGATASGIPTLGAFFTVPVAERIHAEYGPATVMLANNVIANIDDLDDLTRAIRSLLAPDGVFVFQTQYGADVLRGNLLDTIYHEHLSYFHVKPLQSHFRRWNMEIIDVRRIWTKGGSIQVTVQLAKGKRAVAPVVAQLIAEEERDGIYDMAIHRRFAARIESLRDEIKRLVTAARSADRKVCGYGASVGTVTLLTQFELATELDALFDDNPEKDRTLRGPSYALPILPPHAVAELDPALIVIFAWRYADAILAKHRAWLAHGGTAIVPLPDLSLRRQ